MPGALKQLSELPGIVIDLPEPKPAAQKKTKDACELSDTAEHAKRKGGDACDDGRSGK